MQELQFEPEHIKALNIMENSKKSALILAKAGCGKSTIINYFIEKTKKKFALLGTTGISAVNIGGQTIHKFFGIIPNRKGNFMKGEQYELIRETDIFIIDEGPMMRADIFDLVNHRMQKICGNHEFFGGKQLILVGDLFQLPPVPETIEELKKEYDSNYKGLYFFSSKCFTKENFELIEFKKVFRQTPGSNATKEEIDEANQFMDYLSKLRLGYKGQDMIDFFNQRVVANNEVNPKSILIGTTNAIVDKKNMDELMKLPGKSYQSYAYIDREYPPDSYPTDKIITLKKGARVMFTYNHKFGDFVNGTLGTVVEIFMNDSGFIRTIKVELDDGQIIDVNKNRWDYVTGEDEIGNPIIAGSFSQFPLKLAFAITVHKVQGKTFDYILIDLGRGAFVDGQVYVAISRVKTFKGLQLITPIQMRDIMSSLEVKKFISGL